MDRLVLFLVFLLILILVILVVFLKLFLLRFLRYRRLRRHGGRRQRLGAATGWREGGGNGGRALWGWWRGLGGRKLLEGGRFLLGIWIFRRLRFRRGVRGGGRSLVGGDHAASGSHGRQYNVRSGGSPLNGTACQNNGCKHRQPANQTGG